MARQATQYKKNLESGGVAIRYSPAVLTLLSPSFLIPCAPQMVFPSTTTPLTNQSYPHTPHPRSLVARDVSPNGHALLGGTSFYRIKSAQTGFLPYAHIAVSIKEGYMCRACSTQRTGYSPMHAGQFTVGAPRRRQMRHAMQLRASGLQWLGYLVAFCRRG